MSTVTINAAQNEVPEVPDFKDPADISSYVQDLSATVTDLADNIASVAYAVDAGITISSTFPPTNTTTTGTVTLEGGTAGTTYEVHGTFTFASGKVRKRSFKVRVENR